jgi:hypothetical protein
MWCLCCCVCVCVCVCVVLFVWFAFFPFGFSLSLSLCVCVCVCLTDRFSPANQSINQSINLFFRTWYTNNYEELKLLNPNLPLMLRTTPNAMPAITTELEWTIHDLLRFMIQTGRFRDPNGSISQERVEAAQAYLNTDWQKMQRERFRAMPEFGFDPERPFLELEEPEWRTQNAQLANKLQTYTSMKDAVQEQMKIFQGGPNDEWTRAENALLMCQRVDLWCAGEQEVEQAVIHLYKLGRKLNEREVDFPAYIAEFYPGTEDMVA